MKIFVYIINFMLLIGVVLYFTIIGIESSKPTIISVELKDKTLKSSDLLAYAKHVEKVVFKEVENRKADSLEDDVDIEEAISDNTVSSENEEDNAQTTDSVSVWDEDISSDVLETQVGSMSGYGPDCYGCSGILASGLDVSDGTIYYSDATYGNVRILAGDYAYPYGTIVRVKNSKISEFIGIVLDRGGAIGFGKSHLFDLLFPSSSEALAYEVSYNTTFEILRYGY